MNADYCRIRAKVSSVTLGIEDAMNLIMFDIDGTLCQTDGADERCYVLAVSEVAGDWRLADDWSSYRNVTEPGIASEVVEKSLGRPATSEELLQIRDRFLGLLQEEAVSAPSLFSEIPGASEMLQALVGSPDVAVSLATGGWGQTARFKMRAAGLGASLPMSSGDDAVAREQILKLSKERASSHYSEPEFCSVTYVGDGVWDMMAARSLGYHFVGVAAGSKAHRLKQDGASQVVPDFSDLDRFLGVLQEAGRAQPEKGSHFRKAADGLPENGHSDR